MKFDSRLMWAVPLFLVLHALLSWRLLQTSATDPVMVIEMSSTVASEAQLFYDQGSGFNEADSFKVPVLPGPSQQLRFPLPRNVTSALRFDPLTTSGDVVISRAEVHRPGGDIVASFSPDQIKDKYEIDGREVVSNGLHLHISPPHTDPQLSLGMGAALDLRSRLPPPATLWRVAAANAALLFFEGLFIFIASKKTGLQSAGILVLHGLLSALLLHLWSSPPMVEIEMSSSVVSRAQVYWDIGAGMSESESSSLPVWGGDKFQLLRFPVPFGVVKALRFDPLTSPGTIVIRKALVLRADGSTALGIAPGRIRGVIGFDQMELGPAGLRYRIRTDSLDPQLAIDLDAPIDLTSTYAGDAVFARIALWNLGLLAIELILLIWPPGFRRTKTVAGALNSAAGFAASRLSNERFIVFDRLAVWFYITCVALFLGAVGFDLNGSSIGFLWNNFKIGAPANLVAGVPQEIRADEVHQVAPAILYQNFRLHPFELRDTAFGGHNVGLTGEMPVRHVTTWFRPQFWGFFFLPADYAYSAWWQAKGLIMVTGVFTLLLLITQSSQLALIGSLWLLFSQFTQWCYSWPSGLPEMCGLLCFALVFGLYIMVGTNRLALLFSAIAAASCVVDFAAAAYVPHLIPYAWLGALFATAWCFGHRADIIRRDAWIWRAAALTVGIGLVASLMFVFLGDLKFAIAGIANTVYPGHRILNGGGFGLATFGTHFLAASETAKRFPVEYSNINESSGFLWLAPVTLLCVGRIRALSIERRLVWAALWLAAIILVSWMVLPIPASIGHLLFLDRVQGVRCLPALGLINVCIVMLVLSAPHQPRKLGMDAKLTITFPVVCGILFMANQSVHSYFHLSEVLLGTLWGTVLIVMILDDRRLSFGLAVVIPSMFLFGLVNPVERGLPTVMNNPLFDLAQGNSRLREGKWLVYGHGFPSSIFSDVGFDVYNIYRYLPDLDHFPLLAAHGIDTKLMNNLGYMYAVELEPGQPPRAGLAKDGVTLSISPLDPLVKELGIRYLAFHEPPPQEVLEHLKPLTGGTISEFWLYELE
jgi:hypothetical protein